MTAQLPTSLSRTALDHLPYAVVITNPFLDDNPIVYVNRAFERLSGYAAEAAVGRNCRFLQGADTDPNDVSELRAALEKRQPITLDMINYRAQGEKFLNRLHVTPLHDGDGEFCGFLGLQRELSGTPSGDEAQEIDERLREIEHRVKNHLAMIISLIRTQQRGVLRGAKHDYGALARRVEALQLLYQEMSDSGVARSNSRIIPLGAYVTRIASAISHLEGRAGVRVNIDADAFGVSMDTAAQAGLLLSEVLTNALQHAFDEREQGLVEVRLKQQSNGRIRMQVMDDGSGLAEGRRWPNEDTQGSKITKALLNGLGATVNVSSESTGTVVTIDMPDHTSFEDEAN